MNIREFSFKFFSNTLSLNYRLAHFVQGRAQDCTFCRIANVHPVPAETFDHFFFDCEFNTRIRSIFENTLLPELGLAQITERKKILALGNYSPQRGQLKYFFCIGSPSFPLQYVAI